MGHYVADRGTRALSENAWLPAFQSRVADDAIGRRPIESAATVSWARRRTVRDADARLKCANLSLAQASCRQARRGRLFVPSRRLGIVTRNAATLFVEARDDGCRGAVSTLRGLQIPCGGLRHASRTPETAFINLGDPILGLDVAFAGRRITRVPMLAGG